MNIFYYNEQRTPVSGPAIVSYYLTKALAKKIGIKLFPQIAYKTLFRLFSVHLDYLSSKFDLLHFNMTPTYVNGSFFLLESAKKRNVPLIFNVHGLFQLENSPGLRSNITFTRWLNSCLLADKVVVNTNIMRMKVSEYYGIDLDKISIIPNGVDLSEFNNLSNSLVLEGDPAILNISSASWLKGFDIVVEAVAQLKSEFPNLRLHLVSDCSETYYLEMLRRHGVEEYFVFHRTIPHSRIPYYLNAADVCVFASRFEGFGITLIEAMASGTPVVASDIDAFREILSNGKNGSLFKMGDASALANAIVNLHNDHKLKESLSSNALKSAVRYDWDNIADEYISLYNELC